MGAEVLECDFLIPQLLNNLNVRFGPKAVWPDQENVAPNADDTYNGLEEMVQLQREFGIFKKGRPLSTSVNVLGLAGTDSQRAKHRWLRLLDKLPDQGADVVERIVANLESANPKPMFFQARSPEKRGDVTVTIKDGKPEPLPYATEEYIILSIPMSPRRRK